MLLSSLVMIVPLVWKPTYTYRHRYKHQRGLGDVFAAVELANSPDELCYRVHLRVLHWINLFRPKSSKRSV